jgi:YD repeat-containing protein
MNSLREYALEAWAREQERRNHSERKKRKRRAKKIEEDIDDLFPRGAEGLQLERDLDDPRWGVVVRVTDTDGSLLRFTYDDEGDLSLIGECPTCSQEAMSPRIARGRPWATA